MSYESPEQFKARIRREVKQKVQRKRKEDQRMARELPTETKKQFWVLMFREGKKLGEAREALGLSLDVAGELMCQRDMLDSNYGFYLFEWIRDQGYWRQRAHGTLELKHITVRMVKNLKVG